jgi:glycosyltransferase involved in cell wall biosynthesis
MGRYLPHAVESILGQTKCNVEVIVIDDGSTDDTAQSIKPFMNDFRFTYQWQPNAGQTIAKNNGLRLCHGRFIGFCDGDDYWPLDKFERQLAHFADDPELGVVYGNTQHIDHDGNLIGPSDVAHCYDFCESGWITPELFADNFVPFGSVLVKRECFEKLGGFDEKLRMGIDWDLWLRFSTRYKFLYVPELALYYRTWGGQMSKNWAGRYENAFGIMEKFRLDFPNALTARQISHAMSRTYVSRARARTHAAREFSSAIWDCMSAFRHDPSYVVVYKTFARTIGCWMGLIGTAE